MNTIMAEMPIPVNPGKAAASPKPESESDQGQFGEIMKTQTSQDKKSSGTESKKEEQDNPLPGSEGIIGNEQLLNLFLLPDMPAYPLFAGKVNVPATEDGLAEQSAVDTVNAAAQSEENTVTLPEPTAVAESESDLPKETVVSEIPKAENVESRSEGLPIRESQTAAQIGASGSLEEIAPEQKVLTSGQPKQEGMAEHQTAEVSAANAQDRPVTGNARTEKETDSKSQNNEQHMQEAAIHGNTAENSVITGGRAAGEAEAYKADIRPEYMEQIKSTIADNLAAGKQEFEIQLNPANLGKLVIKASYEAGKAVISIVCNEAKTIEAMAHQARELAAIVEERTGTQTVVVVEHPAEDYLEQQGQQKNQQENQQNSRQNEDKKSQFHENLDFLQQLRLGLA